jgi:DNA-binding GntR family transcriptional regulator
VNDPKSNELTTLIRTDVLSSNLEPSRRLRLAELMERYDAPMGKVREALIQLSSEGLIGFEPNRGFSMLPISLAELRDVTTLRIELECRALRDCIMHADDHWETDVISALYLLKKSETTSIKDRRALDGHWSLRHRQFHRALLSRCQSAWTLRFCETLSDHAERYRRFSIKSRAQSRDIHAEHQGIADAAISRKADLACERLAAHYQTTADAVAANRMFSE